ncbi:MAG: hypothetical protein R3C03_05825 [Pirellulaceae bacterium]
MLICHNNQIQAEFEFVTLLEKFNTPSLAVDTLVLRTIDQLMPEVRSRDVRIDLDLDHVILDHMPTDVELAVRNLIVNSLQRAGYRSEISITLIDSPGMESPGQWELEVCDFSRTTTEEAWPNTNQVVHGEKIQRTGNYSNSIAAALAAANRCSGTIEAWHCPQGGIAMILIMPKIRHRAVA